MSESSRPEMFANVPVAKGTVKDLGRLLLISASLLIIVIIPSLACSTALPPPTPSPPPTIGSPEPTPTRVPRLRETLTDRQKQQAVGIMVGKRLVNEASISQDDQRLSLGLVVRVETTQDNAQELGDSFVRLVKTFGPEALPGREIGSGIFDYEITVVYANGTRIAQGAKDSTGIKIAW